VRCSPEPCLSYLCLLSHWQACIVSELVWHGTLMADGKRAAAQMVRLARQHRLLDDEPAWLALLEVQEEGEAPQGDQALRGQAIGGCKSALQLWSSGTRTALRHLCVRLARGSPRPGFAVGVLHGLRRREAREAWLAAMLDQKRQGFDAAAAAVVGLYPELTRLIAATWL